MRAKEIEVATAADVVITLGETMRNHLIGGGVPAEKITLIPNSVSEAVVNADTSRAPSEVRAGLGLPEDGVWVGTAASIVGYEGLDDLVDAVILARAQGTDLGSLSQETGLHCQNFANVPLSWGRTRSSPEECRRQRRSTISWDSTL